METGRTDQHHTPDSPAPDTPTSDAPRADSPTADAPSPATPASDIPTAGTPAPDTPTSGAQDPHTPTAGAHAPDSSTSEPTAPAPRQTDDPAAPKPAAPRNTPPKSPPNTPPQLRPNTPPGPPQIPRPSWPKVVPRQEAPPGTPAPGHPHNDPTAAPPRAPFAPRVTQPPRAPQLPSAPPVRSTVASSSPPPRYHQHRQQPEEASDPDPAELAAADPEVRQAVLRNRATGFATGVLHTLGFTLLAVYEYFRATAGTLSEAQRAAGGPEGLREIAGMQADLGQESWYGAVGDLARVVTFDQPRAALWSAVFLAVLVRLNRSGPPRVQLGLAVLSAGYCALLAVVWFPFLHAVGSVVFLALAATGALLWAVTRR